MDARKKSDGTEYLDDQGFFAASWPLANPPVHPKAEILSVAIGNSSLIWALHTSYEKDFNPTITWRTAAPAIEDLDESAKPKLHPSNVIPRQVLEELFGSADFTISSATQYRYALKRIPIVYVYVISTNPKNASIVVALLKGIPCLFYRVTAKDFVIAPPSSNDSEALVSPADEEDASTPNPVQMYSGIGVDRVASMAGARLLYPKASNVLVIDGGTAMTYTTMVEVLPSCGNRPTFEFAGGICPGLQLRLRALYDYNDDLPLLHHNLISELVTDCIEKKEPLPLFLSFPPVNNSSEADSGDNSDPAFAKSILGCVISEIALLLCFVIRDWLKKSNIKDSKEKSNLPTVVVTGGDGEYYMKLLRPHHSYICKTDFANIELLDQGLSDDASAVGDKRFVLQHTENENEETLRNQLLGLRVVLQKTPTLLYGTIFSVKRAVDLDNDTFLVYSDLDGKIKTLGIVDVYDALSRYCDSPEKPRVRDENLKIGFANKRRDAEEAMAVLLNKSDAVRNHEESRKPPPEDTIAPSRAAQDPEASKKRKLSGEKASQPKKPAAVVQKANYINRRIAKHFLIDEGGAQVMKLFFGTVTEFLKEHSWWHIEYDDGDNEDMSVGELIPYLKLYSENKADDPKKK